MGIDQRRHKRVTYDADILINGSIMAKGIDVSEGGLYVHTGRGFPVGSVVSLTFSLGQKEIAVRAKVKCCHESIGMGLSFVDLDVSDRYYIKGYMAERESRVPVTKRKRVLIVDDNECTRRMNKSKLMLDGLSVVEASDGIEAIGRLREAAPDAVILDLYMERMDGFKVLAYMKGLDDLKDIPVIVFSARGSVNEIERVMAAGAEGFLVKMVTSPVKLSEHVRKVLRV
ncbi:MAG: response regulator [Nitrospirae bacterium]|nr:response regulator [Nitrospirota bacterium]